MAGGADGELLGRQFALDGLHRRRQPRDQGPACETGGAGAGRAPPARRRAGGLDRRGRAAPLGPGAGAAPRRCADRGGRRRLRPARHDGPRAARADGVPVGLPRRHGGRRARDGAGGRARRAWRAAAGAGPGRGGFPLRRADDLRVDGWQPPARDAARGRPACPLSRAAGRAEGPARHARPGLGWHYDCHHTGQGALPALLWLYRALERTS